MYLIDYIGKEGVVTSKDIDREPQAGDIILVRPFHRRNHDLPLESARIRSVSKGRTTWCYSCGCFWYGPGSIDASGGPFDWTTRPIVRHALHTDTANFWNFAGHGAGPGNRVDYNVKVPVWTVDYNVDEIEI